jgi:acetyl esterase/lipase
MYALFVNEYNPFKIFSRLQHNHNLFSSFYYSDVTMWDRMPSLLRITVAILWCLMQVGLSSSFLQPLCCRRPCIFGRITRQKLKLQQKLDDSDDDDTLPKSLPPLPICDANPADDVFRSMNDRIPISWIHFARDSGLFRTLADTLLFVGIPALLERYPQALPNVPINSPDVPKSTKLTTVSYGPQRFQTMDILTCSPMGGARGTASSNHNNNDSHHNKTLLFAHGGAWGSGRPWMYRLAAIPFLQQGYRVVIWGYRTYPDGMVQDQVDDLNSALELLGPSNPISIVGHSSGAHIAVLAALQRQRKNPTSVLCDKLVALSGVYDIPNHYEWETGRGVNEISALKPACGGTYSNWMDVSPTRILATANSHAASMPDMYVLHGATDTVVPYTSAVNMTRALLLSKNSNEGNALSKCKLEILNHVEHSDTVLHLMMGGETRDKVMDWLSLP